MYNFHFPGGDSLACLSFSSCQQNKRVSTAFWNTHTHTQIILAETPPPQMTSWWLPCVSGKSLINTSGLDNKWMLLLNSKENSWRFRNKDKVKIGSLDQKSWFCLEAWKLSNTPPFFTWSLFICLWKSEAWKCGLNVKMKNVVNVKPCFSCPGASTDL